MGASDSRERAIADSQFGAGALGAGGVFAPATWYMGLSTTAPNDDGTGFTEPVGGSYTRLAIANNSTNFPAATTVAGLTTKKNGIAFTFVNPTGFWGSLGWYGFFLASSGGLPEYTNVIDTPITVQSGNTPVEFAASLLVMPWD